MLRNPSYSLRAFARDIKLSASRLSEVMNKNHPISRTSVRSICVELALSKTLTEMYCDLVDAAYGRSPDIKHRAEERLARASNEPAIYEFGREEFQVIADWYHLTILALIETSDFQPDPRWVAARLRLDAEVVIDAVQRLERLGLLAMNDDGSWVATRTRTAVNHHEAPAAMQQFHSQILAKAAESIVETPRDRRYLQAIVAGVPTAGLAELVVAMQDFHQRVLVIADKYSDKTEVIAFAMQVFPLTTSVATEDLN